MEFKHIECRRSSGIYKLIVKIKYILLDKKNTFVNILLHFTRNVTKLLYRISTKDN